MLSENLWSLPFPYRDSETRECPYYLDLRGPHITKLANKLSSSINTSTNRCKNALKPNPAKTLLRAQIEARLAALTNDEKKRQSQGVFQKIINHPYYKSSKRVAIFMSTDQEINTAPIIDHIKAKGASAFVPQYAGGIMRFLKLEDGDKDNMAVTKHGIKQHNKQQTREEALDGGGLDLIISPGVAFTKSGGRLGHGGGYYDKFIAKLRSEPATAPKILALAFNCQILDDVPMDEQDQMIDGVIYVD